MSWDSGFTSYIFTVSLPPKQAVVETHPLDFSRYHQVLLGHQWSVESYVLVSDAAWNVTPACPLRMKSILTVLCSRVSHCVSPIILALGWICCHEAAMRRGGIFTTHPEELLSTTFIYSDFVLRYTCKMMHSMQLPEHTYGESLSCIFQCDHECYCTATGPYLEIAGKHVYKFCE